MRGVLNVGMVSALEAEEGKILPGVAMLYAD